jgi:hypothetical protein
MAIAFYTILKIKQAMVIAILIMPVTGIGGAQ